MPRWEFDYTDIDMNPSPAFPAGQDVCRPIIKVELCTEGHSVCCWAIVDSGADYCSFPANFLPDLGLSMEDLPSGRGHGIGTDFDLHFTNLQMKLDRIGDALAHVGFCVSLNEWGVGLLGQNGFFNLYNISFDRRAKRFVVQG